jgi:signal transduction histidine kinase
VPRLGLTFHLAALNAALVLGAVLGVSAVALHLLRGMAEDEALARVALAGAASVDEVAEARASLRRTARLLADRPTLARLAAEGDAAALRRFLDQFGAPARLAGCAVVREGALLAASTRGPTWTALAPWPEPGSVRLVEAGDGLLLVTTADVTAVPGVRAVVAAPLDGPTVTEMGERVGLPITFVRRGETFSAGADVAGLRARVLAGGPPERARVGEAYVAVHPLRDSAGDVAALAEVRLPAAAVDARVTALRGRMIAFAVATGGLAAAFGLALARRLGRPLAALARSADRIGAGDLGSPVPRAAGREAGALAQAMEDMRGRLLGLTAALRRREAEAQALLGGMVEGVLAVDEARRVTYLSPQAERLLGVSAAEAAGRFCGDVLRPRASGGSRPCDADCPIVHARARDGARAVEHLPAPDGGWRSIVVTSAPPVEGRQVQLLRDETDVEAAHRLRDVILANVSHEMRTPLAAQRASLELLRDGLGDLPPDALRDLVRSLERGTLRLTRLIDNLLESAHVEAGGGRIRSAAVELDEVVEEAGEFVRPLLGQRGQRLSVELPFPLPPIRGDGPRLVQVFVNLLANAHKFAPPSAEIRIGGRVEDAAVTLWVENEGSALPPGAGRSVFDRFYRAPGGEPEEAGLGLGLWLVESIVARHGGTIEARTEHGWTRLTMRLPRPSPAGGDAP